MSQIQYRIWIAGLGGQGVSFLGQLLSRAAYLERKHVESRSDQEWAIRGGLIQTSILADEAPFASGSQLDFNWALLLHPAVRNLQPPLSENATILDAYQLELYHLTRQTGFPQGLNMALLGFFLARSGFCQPDGVAWLLKRLLGKEQVAVLPYNLDLLERGLARGQNED